MIIADALNCDTFQSILVNAQEVLSCLVGDIEDEELAELEHIRWCRFHHLNYWQFAKHRDNKKRLHNDLKMFKDLSQADRLKNYVAVNMAKNNT